jgi:hypothetical protein
MYQRDPVSVLLDRGAREMLARVYAAPRGQWVMTRLADPSPGHAAWARGIHGIDVSGPDNAPTLSGRHVNAHTRWGRAFMRALWHQHRWYGPRPGSKAHTAYLTAEKRYAGRLENTVGLRDGRRMQPYSIPLQVEWGRRLPGSKTGRLLPAGRAVRVRIAYGGMTAQRAVRAKPDDGRIYTDDGDHGGRYSLAGLRDWA